MGEPVHEISDQNWDFMLDINARTLLHAARAVVPQMIEGGGGKIVNVGAFSAQRAPRKWAPRRRQSAVIRLTETMAAELREKNINVNCVLPTVIDTPENRASMPKADRRAGWRRGSRERDRVSRVHDRARFMRGDSDRAQLERGARISRRKPSMAIYRLGAHVPSIPDSACVSPEAVLIGRSRSAKMRACCRAR
jgi:NAD(P)-dependent dehydrogenase (short-subunit alcohol dehydrogenase family)